MTELIAPIADAFLAYRITIRPRPARCKASAKITMDVYAEAVTTATRTAQTNSP